MPNDDDLGERLRRLGFRLPRDAFAAFLTHLHKSRVGPTETLEQLAELEERARDGVNLARRTRFACLGTFKTLDRFDWATPARSTAPSSSASPCSTSSSVVRTCSSRAALASARP